jgi:hypothetical protein
MKKETYESLIEAFVTNPSAAEGKTVNTYTRFGEMLALYVDRGKLYSFGSHYLMCAFDHGYALVNSDRYSQSTSSQLNILYAALSKRGIKVVHFLNHSKNEHLSNLPALRNFLSLVEGRISGRMAGHTCKQYSLFDGVSKLIIARKNPGRLLEDLLDEDLAGYLAAKGLPHTIPDLIAQCGELVPNLVDVDRVIKDPHYIPTTDTGRKAGLALGRAENYDRLRINKALRNFYADAMAYGMEVAAINLAPQDGGRALQSFKDNQQELSYVH